jgi:hypothetical protein
LGNPFYGWSFSIKVVFKKVLVRVLVVIFFLASTSMEMPSSIISDLFWPFAQWQDLLRGVNGGVIRLKFYRYGL